MGVLIHREFNIATVNCDGELRLQVEGELDLATAPLLEDVLNRAQADEAALIVIDLTEVSFIDSTGLRSLLAGHARSLENGHRLRITGGSEQAQKLFCLAGVYEQLPLLATPSPKSHS